MGSWLGRALVSICALSTIANAQTPAPQQPAPPPMPTVPATPSMPATPTAGMPDPNAATAMPAAPVPEEPKGPKEHKRGDFEAGGQLRFPSGPDENGTYDSFNWIALDAKARYYLLKSITVDGLIPIALKKPDSLAGGTVDPSIFGGINARFDLKILMISLAYMREGALLLSEKDFPLYVGDFKPGITTGLKLKIKLSSVVDFAFLPTFVYQKGSAENLQALQVPTSLILKLGSLIKVSADAGIYTGDDLSIRAKNGGRIYLGAALDVKLGPIIAHAGAGFASLLTDAAGYYPSIKDSLYVDLNVKYAK
jgi:hypothetical protein